MPPKPAPVLAKPRWRPQLLGKYVSGNGEQIRKCAGVAEGRDRYQCDASGSTLAFAHQESGGHQHREDKNGNAPCGGRDPDPKIVIHIIGQPSSVLSALQTGQLDAASGATSTVQQAKTAGMNVVPTAFGTWTLVLDDRAGAVSKPLASLDVREAINYAIDRTGIVKAVAGGYGVPTDEALATPGTSAYSNSLANYYSYNVAKAKR